MKKKTTLRLTLIVSAFVLLTLPSMINASRASASPAPAVTAESCLGEYLSCLVNTGDAAGCLDTWGPCL